MKKAAHLMIETALFALCVAVLLLLWVGAEAQAGTLSTVSQGIKIAQQSVDLAQGARSQVTGGKGHKGEIPVCAKSKTDGELLGLPVCSAGCIVESTQVYTQECTGALMVGFYAPKAKKEPKQSKRNPKPVACDTDADCERKNPELGSFDVPYMVTMDKVTPAALAACRADSNCMDIESFR
ncbi:MAG TPA: hypothetical protein VFW62_01735 [bacterium]|nr:hypothetical protein [bacterium]